MCEAAILAQNAVDGLVTNGNGATGNPWLTKVTAHG